MARDLAESRAEAPAAAADEADGKRGAAGSKRDASTLVRANVARVLGGTWTAGGRGGVGMGATETGADMKPAAAAAGKAAAGPGGGRGGQSSIPPPSGRGGEAMARTDPTAPMQGRAGGRGGRGTSMAESGQGARGRSGRGPHARGRCERGGGGNGQGGPFWLAFRGAAVLRRGHAGDALPPAKGRHRGAKAEKGLLPAPATPFSSP
jgi:hypothetical protein